MELTSERFRILSELGRGGMGAVYRATDAFRGGQEVALKLIRLQGDLTREQELRFREEFRAMAKLKHPNTVAVFDFGQLDGQTRFLTMELVSGRSLTDLLAEGPLAPGRAVPLLIQLLQALSFIHARRYVHRDVKAENLRVGDDGTLKLLDFGLMGQLGVPSTGRLTGTAAYMAPEVVRGGPIDAATDLYSVGCLAYQLLAGRLPFEGEMAEVVRAHLDRRPVPLREVRPDVPERLEAVVTRLLAKDRAIRYREAREVIEALAEFAGVHVARENLEQRQSYLHSGTLIARDRELHRLETALAEALTGTPRSVFVGAPAGVGKSRLVGELLLDAKLADVLVLQGQCLEAGMAPYEPLVQALRPLLVLSRAEELAPHAPVLARLFPELEAKGFQAASPLEPTAERLRLHETIVAWLRALSARLPLALHLEDLHWCDPNSLEAFNHCVRHAEGRTLFLSTFRNDEAPTSSPIWYTVEEGLTHYMALAPLTPPDVQLLLKATLHTFRLSAAFGAYLHQVTGGNAFFLTEVLRYLIEEGLLAHQHGVWVFPDDGESLALPRTVGAAIVRRLEQLSAEARAVARAAAVLGRYPSLAMLHAVSLLDEEALFRCLDELIERQFIVRDEARYAFPHDWVRETLYATTSEGERRALHQRCGEYLEGLHAADPAPVVSELAHHFSRGSEPRKAFDYLCLAANQAKAVGTLPLAVEHWKAAERLLQDMEHPDKEAKQAELWWAIGSNAFESRPADAIQAFEQLIPLLEAQGALDAVCGLLKGAARGLMRLPAGLRERLLALVAKPLPYRHRARRGLRRLLPPPITRWVPRTIEAYGLLGAAYSYVGKPQVGRRHIERALDLLPFKETPLEGALLVAKAATLFAAGHMDELVAITARARELLFDRELYGNEPVLAARVGAAGYRNAACFQGYRPDEALLDYALAAADELQAHGLKNLVWTFQGIWCTWTGRATEAQRVIALISQNSRKIGAPPYNWALYMRPFIAWQRGEYEEASALIEQALAYPHLDQEVFAEQSLQVLKAFILLYRGELAAAEEILLAAEQRGRRDGLSLITSEALLGRGRLALLRSEHEAARRILGEAVAMGAEGPTRNPLYQAIAERMLGELCLETGALSEARAHAEAAMRIVTDPSQDNPYEQGLLLRLLGDLSRAQRDPAGATEAYERAEAIFDRLQNRHQRGLVEARRAALHHPPEQVAAPSPGGASPDARWRDALLGGAALGEPDAAYHQRVLALCLESFGADEATLFVLSPDLAWAASRDRGGPCGELPTNPALLAATRQELRGRAVIDIPSDMAAAGSNLEVEIPSVLMTPVLSDGRLAAILYLTKRDLNQPYDDAALQTLEACCATLAQGLSSALS